MEVQTLCDPASKRLIHNESLEGSIKFFAKDMVPFRSYLAAVEDGQVVGLVCFVESSLRNPGAMGVAFISTHADWMHRGVATCLTKALFDLASERKKPIAMTPYEEDGKRWLKPVVARTAKDYPDVELLERD